MYINLGEEIPRNLPASEGSGLSHGAESTEVQVLDLILGALKDVTKVRQGQIRMYDWIVTHI